jgi:hypothetical protein
MTEQTGLPTVAIAALATLYVMGALASILVDAAGCFGASGPCGIEFIVRSVPSAMLWPARIIS